MGAVRVHCLREFLVTSAGSFCDHRTHFLSTRAMSTPATLPAHGLTPEQVTACMAISERWSYPGERDGWVMAHNAVRLGMTEFLTGIEVLVARNVPLSPFQVTTVKSYWRLLEEEIHEHHDNEEKLFFPFVASKITLPPKMSADHKVCSGVVGIRMRHCMVQLVYYGCVRVADASANDGRYCGGGSQVGRLRD